MGIEQINEHTDITAKYKQIKKGREIVGFEFSFKEKSKPIDSTSKAVERDPNTADMFTQLTDKQLARIVHSKNSLTIITAWYQLKTLLTSLAVHGWLTWSNG